MTYVADHEPSAAAVQFLEQVGARRLDLSSDLARKHNLRAVPRIALELRVRPANGALIAGQWYVHGTSTAEVYVDQISRALLERIATQEHRDAYAIATRQCENDTAEWRKEHEAKIKALRTRGGDAAVTEWVRLGCNLRPEHYLPSFGYRHGIPPIERGTVLHPTARDASGEPLRLDVHDFTKLDREAAAEWTLPAFVTPASAQERAANHLADTMAKVLERVAEGEQAQVINALAIADRDAPIDPIAVWCALSQAGAEVVLTPDKPYVGETGLVTDTVRLSSGWTIAVTGASFFTVATWWPPGSDCPALSVVACDA